MSLSLDRRQYLVYALLAVALVLLFIELPLLLPSVLERWHPWDYGNYLKMGQAVRDGVNAYGSDRYYPFPTMLWIFAPLSLMPDWFRLFWVMLPFVFLLVLFGSDGMFLLLFPPVWFVVSDAMFDAWLLIPLVWLFRNRPVWAGIGAALLVFKPHVLAVPAAYMVLVWLWRRDWRNLGAFGIVLSVLWLPSFFVNPAWVGQMLSVLQVRMQQASALPLITTSIWSWWALALPGKLGIVFVVGAAIWLATKAHRIPQNRVTVWFLLSLLINPVILASNLIAVLSAVRGRKQILVLIGVGAIAFIVDRWLGNFGGGYALIPLAVLYFQAHPETPEPSPA